MTCAYVLRLGSVTVRFQVSAVFLDGSCYVYMQLGIWISSWTRPIQIGPDKVGAGGISYAALVLYPDISYQSACLASRDNSLSDGGALDRSRILPANLFICESPMFQFY